jgi:hypothetical protein
MIVELKELLFTDLKIATIPCLVYIFIVFIVLILEKLNKIKLK